MKKIRLHLEGLRVQSFATGEARGNGTVKAFSGPQVDFPSDYNWQECAPSGVDTGSLCGCGGSHSGQPGSCDDMSCLHGGC